MPSETCVMNKDVCGDAQLGGEENLELHETLVSLVEPKQTVLSLRQERTRYQDYTS